MEVDFVNENIFVLMVGLVVLVMLVKFAQEWLIEELARQWYADRFHAASNTYTRDDVQEAVVKTFLVKPWYVWVHERREARRRGRIR